MSTCAEVDSEDSAHEMSIASGTTSADSFDHTQELNFDDYIEWHEATYQPDSDAPREPVSTCPDHATDIPDQENSDAEDIDEPGQASSIVSSAHLSVSSRDIAASLPYRVTNETIQVLRHYAEWTYPHLRARFGISLGSLPGITYRNSTSANTLTRRSQHRSLG